MISKVSNFEGLKDNLIQLNLPKKLFEINYKTVYPNGIFGLFGL